MKHYIIDGNNLIGKIPAIKKFQKSRKQTSREKLAFLLGRYFSNQKNSVSLALYRPTEAPLSLTALIIIFSLVVIIILIMILIVRRRQTPKTSIDTESKEITRTCFVGK